MKNQLITGNSWHFNLNEKQFRKIYQKSIKKIYINYKKTLKLIENTLKLTIQKKAKKFVV